MTTRPNITHEEEGEVAATHHRVDSGAVAALSEHQMQLLKEPPPAEAYQLRGDKMPYLPLQYYRDTADRIFGPGKLEHLPGRGECTLGNPAASRHPTGSRGDLFGECNPASAGQSAHYRYRASRRPVC